MKNATRGDFFKHPGFWPLCGVRRGNFRFGKPEIKAAAGRPSGRRPFITSGGMEAAYPHRSAKSQFLDRLFFMQNHQHYQTYV